MTYLPGSDEAILPGTNHITADRVVEDDRHLVVLDLSPTAYPLDGFMATLARTLADVGLMDEFAVLGRNRSAHPRVGQAIEALASEPSIARLLQFTLTPEDAERIATDLADAALEPSVCTWPGCVNYRTDPEHCAAHGVDWVPDVDTAWEATA